MAYTFILEDLSGRALSELPGATAKEFTRVLNGIGTAQVTVPLWHDQADSLLSGDALLKVVDVVGSQRMNVYHGRMVTAEEVADENGGTIAATFADGLWMLMHRLLGRGAAGISRGTALSPVAATSIVTDFVNACNVEVPTGLQLGTITATPANTYTGPHYFTPAGQLIAQLCGVLDGPDFRVEPIDAVASTNPALCYFTELTVAPAIGQTRLDQPFEYGDGRLNVKSYNRAVSVEGIANRVFSLPPGFPDPAGGGNIVSQQDAASQSARGLFDAMVSTDLIADALRQQLVDHHIAVRKTPRQTITFQPVNDLAGDRVPRLRFDYDVGDVMPFRASVKRSGVLYKRIEVLSRVFQAKVTVDEKGIGTTELTVVPS